MIIAGPNGAGKSTLLNILKRNIPTQREASVEIEATSAARALYMAPHRMSVAFEVHGLMSIVSPRKFREVLMADTFSALPSVLGATIPYYLMYGYSRVPNLPDFSTSDVKRRIPQIDEEFNHVLREVYEKGGGEILKGSLPKDIFKPFKNFLERFLHLKFKDVKLEGDFYKLYFINRFGSRGRI
jgi:energy-coupling factor transporter ATP-binding protein EcfA2